MATAQEYSAWLQSNADQRGTEDYKTVERALKYAQSKETTEPAKSVDYNRGRTEAGGVARGLMSVANGPTFGFGDELLGAIGGAYDTLIKGGSFADNYKGNRDYVRGAQDVEHEANPLTTGITQAMASAPMSLLKLPGTALLSVPMGVTRQAAKSAISGAGFGAVSGAGNSTAEDISGVLGDSAMGAATGGALGAVATPVIRGAAGAAGNVASRFSDSAAGRYAKEKIAEAFARDATGAAFTSGAANPMDKAAARLQRLGNSAVMADAGGQNTRQLLDTAATLPGATKQAVEDMIHTRQAGRAGRMIDAADTAMGTQGARLAPTLQTLVDDRTAASKPLYDALRPIVFNQPSARLQEIVANAHDLGATGLGKKIALGRMQPYTLNPEMPFGWKMTDLDNLKRGLDTLISKETDAVTQRVTPLGHAVLDLKRALTNELDHLTTDRATGVSLYKSARDAFAGPSQMIDAANAGKASMSMQSSQIARVLDGMTQSEQQAFKVGAFEALREKLGNSSAGRTEIINMWQNPAMREKLLTMFGSERAFRQFASTAAAEGRMKGLETVGRGSQTAARQFAAGDIDNPAMEGVGSALAGVVKGSPMAVLTGAKNAWNSVKTPEAVRDQIGSILLTNGANAKVNMQAVRDLVQQINERRNMSARGMGLFMGNQGPGMLAP